MDRTLSCGLERTTDVNLSHSEVQTTRMDRGWHQADPRISAQSTKFEPKIYIVVATPSSRGLSNKARGFLDTRRGLLHNMVYHLYRDLVLTTL